MANARVLCKYQGSVWCSVEWINNFSPKLLMEDGLYVPVRFTPKNVKGVNANA